MRVHVGGSKKRHLTRLEVFKEGFLAEATSKHVQTQDLKTISDSCGGGGLGSPQGNVRNGDMMLSPTDPRACYFYRQERPMA